MFDCIVGISDMRHMVIQVHDSPSPRLL